MFLGSLALVRFPDVFTRTNAATKSATFGVCSTMLATFFYFLFIQNIFASKILLTIVFVFLTAPIVGFVVLKSSYKLGIPIVIEDVNELEDDLGEDHER
ncbi:hypothetical protein SYNTR_0835 [Candidatus Syntrophocurvum alkaliphilum]|uniref:Na(+) H(+) antiporter subunit G n=1 Tax=Candidatus Syntrophocurvum alkaliphilum TaxID=2293317 RepID=A0A6I6D927_9FIRM|nr:monovalent cation/H(+) antiporter subunit G [Candidatus Syntrophocurvum alkaliphilum]QGT99428.1 hypothetical protein SYNTR_0835 [Candidatus Syntrophocurvum alkaliphilum]